MAKRKKVAVIGAGLGGISAALRLSQHKFDVTVFEQNSTPGGKANVICKNGFRFDTGPSLLTMPFVIQDLFEYINEDISKYFTVKKLDVLCKYFYPDGKIINAYSDLQKFKNEIDNKTSVKANSIDKYFAYSKNIYDLTAELFLMKSFSEPATFLNSSALKTLLNINKIDPFRTVHQANQSFFTDDKMIQLFDRYATYNGSNPFIAPATLNIIPYVEFILGGFIIEEGIYALPNSLYQIAENKGVKFNFNSKVEKIIFENSFVKGISTNGKFHNFDLVISNADVNNTYKYLLNEADSPGNIINEENLSTSAIVFYWGVKIKSDLEIHNILFSENYKKEFDEIFIEKNIPLDPTIYIYISSKFKKEDAPENCENWFVMINSPFRNFEDQENEINRIRERIINKINTFLQIDISGKIIFEGILTPDKLEKQTGSYKGSIYGISSNNKKAAFLRQQNKSRKYKGLYFTGGSAHPGGGIPLVLLSGKITSELILKYEND